MNYKKIYDSIIHNRLSTPLPEFEYGQKHHILPRSLYPDLINEKSNIVKLTVREHYICHWLLTKIHPCKEMMYAFFMMASMRKKQYYNSYSYESIRKEFLKNNSSHMKEVWSDKELREKQSKDKKAFFNNPENREKTSKIVKELWKNEDYIEKQKKVRTSVENRKKLSDNKKLYYSNPENRKKASEQRKAYSAKNPKMWINNGVVSRQIKINEPIPEGFIKGRIKWGK